MALVGDLDHAAGVDEVVGAVDDAPLGEPVVDAVVDQLVVGAAAHDRRPQHLGDLVVERAAERARRVDVERGAHQRVGVVDDVDAGMVRAHPARSPPGRRR